MKFFLSYLGVVLIIFCRFDVFWLSYIIVGILLSENIWYLLEVGVLENLSILIEKIFNKEKENKINKISKKFE